jgi:hypothetical protein
MPPKSKGGKAKSKGGGDHAGAASPYELLAQIEETGDLPLENRLALLYCSPTPCPGGCKGGRKDNPACLCGLIPEVGHFKKSGLFQKLPAILGELGIDPATQRRAVRTLCRRAGRGEGVGASRWARFRQRGEGIACVRAAVAALNARRVPAPLPAGPPRRRPTAPSACATWATRAT